MQKRDKHERERERERKKRKKHKQDPAAQMSDERRERKRRKKPEQREQAAEMPAAEVVPRRTTPCNVCRSVGKLCFMHNPMSAAYEPPQFLRKTAVAGKCRFAGCERFPKFDHEGGTAPGEFCSEHADGGMVDVTHDYELGCTFEFSTNIELAKKSWAPQRRNPRCNQQSSRNCPCGATICEDCADDKSHLARRQCAACSRKIGPCYACAADTKECENCHEPVCIDCAVECGCGASLCHGDCKLYHAQDCDEGFDD